MLINKNFNLQNLLENFDYDVDFWLRPLGLFDYFKFRNNTSNHKIMNFDIIWRHKENFLYSRFNYEDTVYISNKFGGVLKKRLDNFLYNKIEFNTLSNNKMNIMGILNKTPDSFYDGGVWNNFDNTIKYCDKMLESGANIIDVGGESTRPNSIEVKSNEEIDRILPIVKRLVSQDAYVSVDTRNIKVIKKVLDHGVKLINDISGLKNIETVKLISEYKSSVVIMHMQGTPETMQRKPKYNFAPIDIFNFLENKINFALSNGITKDKIIIDPGFGFGKLPIHNMQITAWLPLFQTLGYPILLGASRKSSIASLSNNEVPELRLPGSLSIATLAYLFGTQILRVHDVEETVQSIKITKNILKYL